MQAVPDLSVIIVAHRESETFRMAMRSLRAQTMAPRLEVILVTGSRKNLDLHGEDLEGLFSSRVVEVASLGTGGLAKAAGVTAARAALVAFMEDHSYPDARWAEALLEAHRQGDFAAVGPVMRNANPESATSWGSFLVFYGPWMTAVPGEATHLPANQSCYRREVLLEYGERLQEMLGAESLLHWDLLSRGRKLRHEPAAKVYHLNFSLLSPVFREYYLASRIFAANRARNWGRTRRAVYACGSPLLPLIRLPRVLKDARLARLPAGVLVRSLIPAAAVLAAGAAGEMLGYALGEGAAAQRLLRFEAERHLFITPRDLVALSHDE